MALEKAEYVLKIEPGNEDALLLKATILMAKQNDNEAMALLQSMEQRGMKRPEIYILTASAYLKGNNMTEAENVLRRGIAANPKISITSRDHDRYLHEV